MTATLKKWVSTPSGYRLLLKIQKVPMDLWPEPKTKFSGYHGYWPISNTKVDYRFGDEKLMKEIIEAAHEKDMNVILDYVANHVHEEHPVYKEHPEWATNLYLPDSTFKYRTMG